MPSRVRVILPVVLGLVLTVGAILWVTRPTGVGHVGASGHATSPVSSDSSGEPHASLGAANGGHVSSNDAEEGHVSPDDAEEGHADAHPEVAVAAPGAYQQTRASVLAVLATSGPADALAELDRLIQEDPSVSGICHAVAHDLGHATLVWADGDAARALSDRDDVCGGGYTHGVIEYALGESSNVKRDLLQICAPRQDGSCWHGVGHGLMFATDMNVARSLRLCDRALTFTLAHRCAEGVYMQLFSGDIAAAHAAGADLPTLDVARAECEGTRETYQANCWFYSPNVWLAEHPDDFAGALNWCAGASTELGRASCVRGTGSRTVKYHPDDLSVGEGVCALAGPNRRDCIAGMASYWSVHWKGEVEPRDLCSRLTATKSKRLCREMT